ncbi:SDR family oxidoreductase [Xenorhabdus bovienii]|uniref:SDR family oxidoreductase n=1 Tax=Xenorhabdus bovienii TaxID=40576 RepID=UPI003DA3649A
MSNVFISGVSDGIGFALATLYLKKGWTVFGTSRRRPEVLCKNKRFIFKKCDLLCSDEITNLFNEEFMLIPKEGISIIYLNAGISGNVPARAEEFSIDEINQVLSVNVISNKLLLDIFLNLSVRPEIVVISASIAGLRFRAGMLPYSLSKAALLALCGVYAQENPDIFFAVIGMCNVRTKLSNNIIFNPRVSEFPEHIRLKERFLSPGYVVSPEKRASDVFNIIHSRYHEVLTSGQFIDIREIPKLSIK